MGHSTDKIKQIVITFTMVLALLVITINFVSINKKIKSNRLQLSTLSIKITDLEKQFTELEAKQNQIYSTEINALKEDFNALKSNGKIFNNLSIKDFVIILLAICGFQTLLLLAIFFKKIKHHE